MSNSREWTVASQHEPVVEVKAGAATRTKQQVADLAVFGGQPLFAAIRSASNLVQPPPDTFFRYVQPSFQAGELAVADVENPTSAVRQLERRLAETHDASECVCFCNGLWAIVVTLTELKLSGKTEVVMPSLTYRRLADIAAWTGLVPRFCDVDLRTLSVTAETLRPCIGEDTACLLIAHPIVHVAPVDEIQQLADQHSLPLIFDSVEAGHASVGGRMLGGSGRAECHSLHASKLLNGFEGGYVTTNDKELAHRLRRMRTAVPMRSSAMQAKLPPIEIGLCEIHAAMALASLDDLPDQLARNRKRHEVYAEALAELSGLRLVGYDRNETRSYKNTLVELDSDWLLTREQTIRVLHAERLLVRPYYSPPLHRKPTRYETRSDDLPVTDQLSDRLLLLPSGDFLTRTEASRIGKLLHFLGQHGEEIAVRLDRGEGSLPCEPSQPSQAIPSRRAFSERRDAEPIGWEQFSATFSDLFSRRYYTNHGPLAQQLETLLGEQSGSRHAVTMANAAIAAIIAVKASGCGAWTMLSAAGMPRMSAAVRWAGGEIRAKRSTGVLADRVELGNNFARVAALCNSSRSLLLCDAAHAPYNGEKFVLEKRGAVLIALPGTDAACVITNDDAWAARMRNMRSSYGAGRRVPVELTGNGRMSEAQAAVALMMLFPASTETARG